MSQTAQLTTDEWRIPVQNPVGGDEAREAVYHRTIIPAAESGKTDWAALYERSCLRKSYTTRDYQRAWSHFDNIQELEPTDIHVALEVIAAMRQPFSAYLTQIVPRIRDSEDLFVYLFYSIREWVSNQVVAGDHQLALEAIPKFASLAASLLRREYREPDVRKFVLQTVGSVCNYTWESLGKIDSAKLRDGLHELAEIEGMKEATTGVQGQGTTTPLTNEFSAAARQYLELVSPQESNGHERLEMVLADTLFQFKLFADGFLNPETNPLSGLANGVRNTLEQAIRLYVVEGFLEYLNQDSKRHRLFRKKCGGKKGSMCVDAEYKDVCRFLSLVLDPKRNPHVGEFYSFLLSVNELSDRESHTCTRYTLFLEHLGKIYGQRSLRDGFLLSNLGALVDNGLVGIMVHEPSPGMDTYRALHDAYFKLVTGIPLGVWESGDKDKMLKHRNHHAILLRLLDPKICNED